jgi:SAM-dependent methyltransferase
MTRESMVSMTADKAITLGHPSYVWRAGQERRLEMIRRHAPLEGARILDVGCGMGMYVRAFRRFSEQVYGVDVDPEKVAQANQELPHIQTAPAEELPFADGFFDVVLLHEVLEHVGDDRQAVREAHRVTKVGGRMVVFAPNRLWPWETHGVFWRGQYHFGNVPLVNYLPNRLRNKLAGHVRVYTGRGLRRLFHGLPGRVLHHSTIYPGFDNLAARRPALARLVRGVAYTLEKMPLLRSCGLSHFLIVQKGLS